MFLRLLLCVCCFIVILGPAAAAEIEAPAAIHFSDQDRVLVIAPHPDDETIGAGGVIQQARKAGAKVKVCLLTQGENNEFAFIVYERRIVLKPKEFLRLGEVRRRETVDAMKLLGVDAADVVSLGYPDYGTLELFLKYWGDVKPFRSMLSRVRKVPYAEALTPGAAYLGDNLLTDLKKVIADYNPTKIFVTHPGDVNRDHRAAYLFTRVALWTLEDEHKITPPELYPFIVHVVSWPVPRGYRPELPSTIPPGFDVKSLVWKTQELDSLEISKKFDAVLEYPSQIKYAPRYLVTFARRNELFGDFAPLRLERQLVSDAGIVWSDVPSPNDSKRHLKSNGTKHFAVTAYARQGNYLVIKLLLRHAMDKEFGITVSLAGYSPTVPFEQMPKISLISSISGFYVKDKKKTIPSKDVIVIEKDKELIFKVPLTLLGNPDRVLSSARTALYDLAFDETPWRVLELP
ncbi:MAG: PIG-L family deacetylase [Candidatus Omnitrophota bacterium]